MSFGDHERLRNRRLARSYKMFAPGSAGSGSCTNFCVNVCTRLYTTGVQQCINDCLACSGQSAGIICESDLDFFDNDECGCD